MTGSAKICGSYKQMPLADLIDLSLNETLPRTIMTSLSILLALLALYFFGGEVIRGFTFTMIWGVIVGTYSSIYIAAPFLIFTGRQHRRQTDRTKACRHRRGGTTVTA